MTEFKDMLKYLRNRKGLSQRELAEKINVSGSTIGMYESGKRRPRPADEEALADFFNVSISVLRGRDTESLLDDAKAALLEEYDKLTEENKKVALRIIKTLQ